MKENGNGAGGGEVLPFPARGRRGSLRKQAPPGAGEAPSGDAAPSLAERVCRLAARGLDEEEIRVRLDVSGVLDEATEQELAAAFRRGQLLGRAQIKEAQFEAALQGRVTAQTRVLSRLGEPPGEERGDEGDVEVVRRVLPDGEEEAD